MTLPKRFEDMRNRSKEAAKNMKAMIGIESQDGKDMIETLDALENAVEFLREANLSAAEEVSWLNRVDDFLKSLDQPAPDPEG